MKHEFIDGRHRLTPEWSEEKRRLAWFQPKAETKTIKDGPNGDRLLRILNEDLTRDCYGYQPIPTNETELVPLPDFALRGWDSRDECFVEYRPKLWQEVPIRLMLTYNTQGEFLFLGAGKTFISIFSIVEWIRLWKEAGSPKPAPKFLVVGTKGIIPTWQNQIAQFCHDENNKNPYFRVMVLGDRYSVAARAEMLVDAAEYTRPLVVISNYESFRSDVDSHNKIIDNAVVAQMKENNVLWDACILDESVKIRYTNTQAFRGIMECQRFFRRRYLLTGLPAPQSLSDYVGQLAFLHPIFLGYKGRGTFERDFAIKDPYTQKISGWRRAEWIHKRIHDVAISITLEDAGLELPECIYSQVVVPMAPDQEKAYDSLAAMFVAYVEETKASGADMRTEAPNILARLTRLSQITGGFLCGAKDKSALKDPDFNPFDYMDEDGELEFPTLPPLAFSSNPKLEALKDLLSEEGEIGNKVPFVVVARFHHEINLIKQTLEEMGFLVGTISGKNSSHQQGKIEAAFKSGEINAIILQIDCGKGLNLQTGHAQIYYSVNFNYDSREQSEKRLHRFGVKHTVTIVDILCEDSLDGEIIDRLKKKKSISELILKHPGLVKPGEYKKTFGG